MLIPVVSSYFLLFSILLGLLCCLCSPTKTLLHSGNVEDWPLLGSCCSSFLSGFASDRKIVPRIQGNLSSRNVELMQCVNSTAAVSNARILKRMLPAPRLLVGVVTYASSDIWDYAAIAAAVNQKYSGLRGYLFFVLDEHSRNFEPRDQRWNKVKILHQAFDSWARNFDYLVWIDADLAILDMDLRLEAFFSEFPEAHIIVSAEHAGSSTLINSGSILCKNSLWTKSFLADWWGFADRKLYSDQEQFDMLLTYRQKHFLNNSSSNLHIGYYLGGRLAILPPDAINTDPPAMTQHQLHNPVVHLMGEHSNLRIKAFSSAHSEQCRQAYSAAHFHNCTNFFCKIISAKFPNLANQSLLLAPQLSVTKDNLLVWTLEVYSVESELLLRNFATVVHSYHVGLNGSYCDEIDLSDMKRLSNAVHHFAHALEYSANKEIRAFYRQKMINQAMGLRKWVYQLLRKHYTNLLLLIKKKSLIEKFCHSIAVDWPEIIKTVSTAGQHLLGSPLISINTRLEIADELNRDMEDMLKSSDRQQHNAIYQMKVHLILQMGLLHLEQSSQTVSNSNLKALELFLKALSLSEEVAKVSGDHTLVTPLELAANLLATTGRHEEAFSMYQRALDISEKHLGSQHNGRTLLYINFGMSMIEKAHDLKIESGCSEKSVNLAISGLSALTTAKKLLKKKEGMANDMSARISVFVAMAGDLIISCE